MATVHYQTIEEDGSVGGGQVTIPAAATASQAQAAAVAAAPDAVSVDAYAAYLPDGSDMFDWDH